MKAADDIAAYRLCNLYLLHALIFCGADKVVTDYLPANKQL